MKPYNIVTRVEALEVREANPITASTLDRIERLETIIESMGYYIPIRRKL
jgi:hypothetical protein